VLDGEIVYLDENGKPQFRDLLFRWISRLTTSFKAEKDLNSFLLREISLHLSLCRE
jgi:ATP-dependent DNA ligase